MIKPVFEPFLVKSQWHEKSNVTNVLEMLGSGYKTRATIKGTLGNLFAINKQHPRKKIRKLTPSEIKKLTEFLKKEGVPKNIIEFHLNKGNPK